MMRSKHPILFFSRKEKDKIVEAIRRAETETSGEIRVHLISATDTSMTDRAAELFEKLGMTRTEERNGVLILLCVKDKQFAILGDRGIHEKVPEHFWDDAAQTMVNQFKQNRFADGIAEAVLKTGEKLKAYFPRQPGDVNELPDEISYSG